MSSEKPKFGGVTDKCQQCQKSVYPLEKLEVEKTVFHKKCFKCEQCQCNLLLGNYSALSGKFYCKPHFKQLFALKGNYDESFGMESHKSKWDKKDEEN